MRRFLAILLTVLGFAWPMAMPGGVSAQDETTLKVANDPALGAILTDGAGMTLYLYPPDDQPNASTCYDRCAEAWPPLTPDEATALPEGVPGELTVFDRTDGTKQVAYNGIPLYYFAEDNAPGDVKGQGLRGVWFVVAPGAEFGPYAAAPGEGTPVPTAAIQGGFTEELGPYLVDAEGKTVYVFLKDTTAGQSVCTGDCAANWPPVAADGNLTLAPGLQGTLASIEREDGSAQLTYNDIPLYYFAADKNPGDTNGQDVGDVWYVVIPGMKLGDEPHEDEEHEAEEAGTPASS